MIRSSSSRGQRQRLLDEDRLAGLQRPADQVGVRGVPGHDEDRVERSSSSTASASVEAVVKPNFAGR